MEVGGVKALNGGARGAGVASSHQLSRRLRRSSSMETDSPPLRNQNVF